MNIGITVPTQDSVSMQFSSDEIRLIHEMAHVEHHDDVLYCIDL